MQRRPLILAALALLPAASASAAERLPMRNLLVEVRQGDESQLRASGGGIEQGAVVIGPNGEVSARGGVGFEARGRSDARSTSQQVSVLNGGRAAVRVGASVPLQWLQWAWTPNGPVVVAETGFVETGRGFVVQPRWPGGDAPVTVEVSTEASDRAFGGLPSRHAPDGQPLPEGSVQQAGVLTTVQLPLGEWVTVARSGDTQRARERGVLSSRDAQRVQGFVLQMRVTAP
ncbi:MAG: hypothetical protein H0U56_12330 [Methylibium sp.]|uniref:hypothetical protein n=1 Tax=Methylibium sp. TaxID=2067992 RepID=UPI0017FFD8AE|nr:hypothetical protein [Methylibium sp.]MBA2723651.1 hypothetical protein [Methylibium sp.]MBA3590385.1 hypothetical protein [Methylibium sp.]